MADFNEIDEARKVLGLGKDATLGEIKSIYRRLAFQYHPDKNVNAGSSEHSDIMKKLNWAYRLLLQYCHDYRYTFTEEDVARTYFEAEEARKWKENWFNSI